MKWVSLKESCEHLPQILPAMQLLSEMANLPLDILEQFFPLSIFFPFRCVTAGLCSPVPLQMAPTRCLRLPSQMKHHAVTVWGSWRSRGARGQGRASLLPRRAVKQLNVSDTSSSPSAKGCHIPVSRSPVPHST